MSGDGFDPIIGALNTSLNLRLMNQNVISANIANADTPGYKAKKLEFEQAFRNALGLAGPVGLAATQPEHLSPQPTDPVNPEIYEDPNDVESLDGNTVNRSDELARQAENQILYDTSTEILKRKLGMLKYSIAEGGGGGR